jgi:hypothetical protein
LFLGKFGQILLHSQWWEHAQTLVEILKTP